MDLVINWIKSAINAIKYNNLLQNLQIPKIGFLDIIELIIIIIIIYKIISSIKDTRAWIILKGVFVLLGCYFIAYLCSFNVIMTIFQGLMSVIAIAIVIMFQSELKKILENIGTKDFFSFSDIFKKQKNIVEKKYISDKTIDSIVVACREMGKVKTGALIVIKKDIPLNEYISTGIDVDAKISSQMLIQIFEHNTPLHDGAVIIENDKIASATCYLPLSDNSKISKNLGTRHRAGIGISEVSDCLVVMVSEETGAISIAENGNLLHKVSDKTLEKKLLEFQSPKIKKTNTKEELELTKLKLTKNKKYKIISTLVGLLLWLVIANSTDPITIKSINQIKVNVTNEETLIDADQTYSITSGKTANIVIKGRRSVLNNLNAEDFIAEADLSQLSIVNSVPIKISTNKDVDIIENNNTLTVKLEELSTIECDVEVITEGTVKENLYIQNIDVVPGKITITGPVSQLNTIGKVVVNSNCNNAYDGYSEELEPEIFDKNGSKMDTTNLTLSTEKIKIIYNIFNTKIVDLKVNIKNTLFEKGEITEYSTEPSTIRIAGPDEVLENTNSLVLDVDIDINNNSKTSNMIKTIDIKNYLTDKKIYIKEEDTFININFTYERYIEKEFVVQTSNIKIKNKDDKNYKYDFSDSTFVLKVSGLSKNLNDIDINTLNPYIDAKSLKEGNNKIKVDIEDISKIHNIIESEVEINMEKKEEKK